MERRGYLCEIGLVDCGKKGRRRMVVMCKYVYGGGGFESLTNDNRLLMFMND
jgi:hypothetical protein